MSESKEMVKQKRNFLFYGLPLILFWIMLLPACYEPVEGCLDAAATNFDVDADDPCLDCCSYPELIVSFTHTAGEAFLSADSLYTSRTQKPYRIKDVKFYLSSFRLVDDAGNVFGVEDKVELNVLQNGVEELVELEDNFQLVRRSSSKLTFGEFRESGNFERVLFFVGVNPDANNANPNSLPDDHPLRIEPDSLHWDQQAGYIFNRTIIQPDTSSADELTIEIGSIPNLVLVDLAFAKSINRGTDTEISILIDYLEWFKGIDFEASEASIRQKIVENTEGAFSIEE